MDVNSRATTLATLADKKRLLRDHLSEVASNIREDRKGAEGLKSKVDGILVQLETPSSDGSRT